ncbi:nuclease-related domain-containing protein [Demequina capsici]|uniref:Nuclease-related domain-containing protein n=1 Tax=Demequina capsici TaxID=3075620 RepID=A0AA96J9V3_9MICO|nr:nuclease-related domain-containing protein [Demequina sp. PMTSA13]WNM26398.1 nuclease-related domain-containing protein [Demequina sp. PMTSA13]
MSEPITVNNWKRYGQHRGYANLPDGTRVGWIDVPTGTITIESPEHDAEARAALGEWHCALPQVPAVAEPSMLADVEDEAAAQSVVATDTSKTAPAPDPEREATDLANRVPGQNAREQEGLAWEREKRLGNTIAWAGRVAGAHTDYRAWKLGAEGEEAVGKGLKKVGKRGWKVLHSIPCEGDTDIDHLVIGPPGVFLVNTKHHPKAKVTETKYGVMVNGGKTEHFPQIRAQVKKATAALAAALGHPVRITGVVAIFNGGLSQPELKTASSARDVKVVTNWNISNALLRLEPVLSDAEVEEIHAVARQPRTWKKD